MVNPASVYLAGLSKARNCKFFLSGGFKSQPLLALVTLYFQIGRIRVMPPHFSRACLQVLASAGPGHSVPWLSDRTHPSHATSFLPGLPSSPSLCWPWSLCTFRSDASESCHLFSAGLAAAAISSSESYWYESLPR